MEVMPNQVRLLSGCRDWERSLIGAPCTEPPKARKTTPVPPHTHPHPPKASKAPATTSHPHSKVRTSGDRHGVDHSLTFCYSHSLSAELSGTFLHQYPVCYPRVHRRNHHLKRDLASLRKSRTTSVKPRSQIRQLSQHSTPPSNHTCVRSAKRT